MALDVSLLLSADRCSQVLRYIIFSSIPQAIPSINFFPIDSSSNLRLCHAEFLLLFPALLRRPLLPSAARRLTLFLLDAVHFRVFSVDRDAVLSHAVSNLFFEDGEAKTEAKSAAAKDDQRAFFFRASDCGQQMADAIERVCDTEPLAVLALLRRGTSMALAEIDGEMMKKDEDDDDLAEETDISATSSLTSVLDEKIVVLSNVVGCYSRLASQDVSKRLTAASSSSSSSSSSSASSSSHCPLLIHYCVLMVDVAEIMHAIASSASVGVDAESYSLEKLDENSPTFLFMLETISTAKSIVSKRSESLKRQKRGKSEAAEENGVDRAVLDRELKTFQTSVTRVINLMINEKQKETIASLMLSA